MHNANFNQKKTREFCLHYICVFFYQSKHRLFAPYNTKRLVFLFVTYFCFFEVHIESLKCSIVYTSCSLKVNQSRYRPGVAQRVPGI